MRLFGYETEVRQVRFPHKPVKSHGVHTILVVNTDGQVRPVVVDCDGAVKG